MISLWLSLLHHGPGGYAVAAVAFLGAFLGAFLAGDAFLVRPVTDRLQLERTGWHWRVARIWWRRNCTVLRDGEQWAVIDWWMSEKGPDAAVWVYAMPLEVGEDADRIEWILLDALTPGLTPRGARRQWQAERDVPEASHG